MICYFSIAYNSAVLCCYWFLHYIMLALVFAMLCYVGIGYSSARVCCYSLLYDVAIGFTLLC